MAKSSPDEQHEPRADATRDEELLDGTQPPEQDSPDDADTVAGEESADGSGDNPENAAAEDAISENENDVLEDGYPGDADGHAASAVEYVTPTPLHERRGAALAGRLGAAALVVVAAGAGTWGLAQATTPKTVAAEQDIPALQVLAADVKPGSATPRNVSLDVKLARPTSKAKPTPQPQARNASKPDSLSNWAKQVAGVTDIPERALWAYGNAELVMRSAEPSCHLSWATLAGLGKVESNHGRFGGAEILPDGRVSKPIIGVPLDGSGDVAAIGDTDGGQLDGDPKVDRAVGPMQFIPSTWNRWAADANGDGRGDPQNIDDAAVTAGRYLCVGGRDMSSASGWWQGVLSYNNSIDYGQKVFGLADGYAKAASQE